MKTLLILFCLFSIACVTSDLKARSVASATCTIDNYQDIIYQDYAEPTQCDLQGADLHGANLSPKGFWLWKQHADLRHADMRHADLRGANLQNADLSFADLRKADLRGADMRHADLRWASLLLAKLQGADLRLADLREADLREAVLRHADLRGAKVTPEQAKLLQYQGLTGFNFYTTVCNRDDAKAKAKRVWGSKVIEIDYDPGKDGYWLVMIDRRGKQRVRFIPVDC